MSSPTESLQDLKIPFRDIELATKNFTTKIGEGGFGSVYEGKLTLSGKLTSVAVKRLLKANHSGQGLKEFLMEIHLLSRHKHPNLVSLCGYCNEGDEKILMYEYAERSSLDKYLRPKKTTCPLTWKQRINICIDVARGLDSLHNHVEENQRIIHRDIKSANILLDCNWKAMIADFGLSKLGCAKENITYACGTPGYVDPEYSRTWILTTKSDVYSFGAVLFEVLCGRLFFSKGDSKEMFLPQEAQNCYREEKLNLIIDPVLKNHVDLDSVKEFSRTASKCLEDDPKQRPSMDLVLEELEKALKLLESEEECELNKLEEAIGLKKFVETLQMQEFAEALGFEIGEPHMAYEIIKVISKMQDTPIACLTREEIITQLLTGILVDREKVWFSIDDYGKNQEMISATKLLTPSRHKIYGGLTIWTREASFEDKSRFSKVVVCSPLKHLNKKSMIRPEFLSSDVTYAAYLLFKNRYVCDGLSFWTHLKYKLNNTSESYTSYFRGEKDNGWGMIELFQTTKFNRDAYLEVMLEGFYYCGDDDGIIIEGIKFLPIHKVR